MIRIATAVAALLACGRSGGVADEQLGNLVIEPKPHAKIDVALAAKDPDELSRALASPHGAVLAALGPHTAAVETTTVVLEAGGSTTELSDRAVLELGEGDTFHGVYTNSGDYGREAIYVGGMLYLRPRYQRWHARAPETAEEPAAIRDQYFAGISAAWDLLAPGAELTELGPTQIAGRAGRRLEVKLAPAPRPNPPEPISQRRWRESRTVERLAGEVVIDADTGMPLAAKLTGAIGFQREGRRFTMQIDLDGKITALGVVPIAAPAEADVVATPERKREVDERDYLLQDIAPPIRKNPDGTAAKPLPKRPGSKP
jgi:hypothetical protein